MQRHPQRLGETVTVENLSLEFTFAFSMLLQRFGEHFKFNFSLIWNSHQLSNMKFWPLHHEHHTHHTRVRISEKFFRGRITVNAGCDALVLALIDVVA